MSDDDDVIVSHAVLALAKLGDPRALPFARRLASHADPAVRSNAKEAIRRLERQI
ncbi:MAG: hypothetical protein JWP32_1324 [Schumannella sp.]|jgi:HEAT repeat protein|nr:hypothetical protein [Schumannella sp.]